MEMSREEYEQVFRARKLWGIIQKPEYAHGEDGLGDHMAKEGFIYMRRMDIFSRKKPIWRRILEVGDKVKRRAEVAHSEQWNTERPNNVGGLPTGLSCLCKCTTAAAPGR